MSNLNNSTPKRVRKTIEQKVAEHREHFRKKAERQQKVFAKKIAPPLLITENIKKENGCWIWQSYKSADGYGFVNYKGKRYRAHRLSYQIFNGKIPDGYYICHRCDNPACVNPEHLFAGTARDNNIDCINKGRKPRPSNAKLDSALAGKIILHIWDHPLALPKVIAQKFNVPVHVVKDIKRGRSYNNLIKVFNCD